MRPVAGVIVALVVMTLFVFGLSIAPWFALGVDGVLQPERFETKPFISPYAALVAVLGAILGGWLCAKISHSRIAVVVLAGLCFFGGASNFFGHLNKPAAGPREPGVTIIEAIEKTKEPLWFMIFVPLAGPSAAWLSGWRTLSAGKKGAA